VASAASFAAGRFSAVKIKALGRISREKTFILERLELYEKRFVKLSEGALSGPA
jgi:hypothetical protein